MRKSSEQQAIVSDDTSKAKKIAVYLSGILKVLQGSLWNNGDEP